MPRRERQLEADGGELVRFAGDLRRLRVAAGGPTYRQLSTRAHYSAAALSEAAGGRKLPSLAVTLAYVRACDGDAGDWEARWRTLAAESVDRTAAPDAVSPYVGLAAFQPEDAGRFFGRDRVVADLLGRLREHRFVGVFGASGSGKSSVLRAGVVAELAKDGARRPTLLFTPGRQPLRECAVALATFIGESAASLHAELDRDPDSFGLRVRQALAGLKPQIELVVVVDQFEETFTLCADPDERAKFVAALAGAANSEGSRTRVIIGVRADFYGHCSQFPALVQELANSQVMIGPMTAEELRQAIVGPVGETGCVMEAALVPRLIADAAGQPAALPLLSHALMETWRRRRGNTLTVAGYELAGGIEHAVARTAEAVFTALNPDQQRVARQIFLRLIALGDGTEDTKRRIGRAELDFGDPNTAVVLEQLTGARLLTQDRNGVELSHEALIRCWPRLGDWLRADRDGLRIHRELTDATAGWESLGRDSDALYRGVRLALAQDWADANGSALTASERAFLQAGLAARAQEQARARRQTWRLRQLVAVLTALLVLAIMGVVVARQARRAAADQRDVAVAQRAIMKADGLAQPYTGQTNSALAVQLKLAAYRLAPNEETRTSVERAFAVPYLSRLEGHTGPVYSMAFSPNGHLLATGGADGTARLWDTTQYYRPEELAVITGTGIARGVAFSPDGRVLVTAGGNDVVRLWDVTEPKHPRPLSVVSGYTAEVYAVAFRPDGRVLATAGGDHVVRLWEVVDPKQPRLLGVLSGSDGSIFAVAFSRDGRLLAAAGADRTVRLWDVADPARSAQLSRVDSSDQVTGVAFSPDGRLLATAGFNHNLRVIDIADPRHPSRQAELALPGHGPVFRAVAFAPDGHTIASVNGIWDVTSLPQLISANVAGGSATHAVAIDSAGRLLAGDGANNTVWVQDLTGTQLGPSRYSVEVAAQLICDHAYPRITPVEWEQYFTGLPYRPPCP